MRVCLRVMRHSRLAGLLLLQQILVVRDFRLRCTQIAFELIYLVDGSLIQMLWSRELWILLTRSLNLLILLLGRFLFERLRAWFEGVLLLLIGIVVVVGVIRVGLHRAIFILRRRRADRVVGIFLLEELLKRLFLGLAVARSAADHEGRRLWLELSRSSAQGINVSRSRTSPHKQL